MEAEQCGRCPFDRFVGPLSLSFDAQMGTRFCTGNVQSRAESLKLPVPNPNQKADSVTASRHSDGSVCSLHRFISSLAHRRGPAFWFRKAVPVDLIAGRIVIVVLHCVFHCVPSALLGDPSQFCPRNLVVQSSTFPRSSRRAARMRQPSESAASSTMPCNSSRFIGST